MSSPSFPVSGSGSSGEGTSDHSLLTNRDSADQHPAASITPVTTNFDGNLSSADDTVQKALETLDASVVAKSLFDANTIIKADSDNTPAALTVGEQTIVGRITSGVIAALSATQVRTLLNVADGANAYTLPTAAAGTLGGIKVGTRLSIADGVLSADEQAGGSGSYIIQNVIPAVVSVDTVFTHYVCPIAGTISLAMMSLESAPSASTTYCKVQVMKNGLLETDSIFTSDAAMQITEVTSATNGVYQASGTLDSGRTAVVAGDVIWIRVNQADAGSAGLRVQVKIDWT
ncbi:MAG: hypothetical protein PHS80_00080 [Methanothrix sp.]|nr:hypothetical protein [Methanothrix sp.]